MKKLYFLSCIGLLFLYSCEKENELLLNETLSQESSKLKAVSDPLSLSNRLPIYVYSTQALSPPVSQSTYVFYYTKTDRGASFYDSRSGHTFYKDQNATFKSLKEEGSRASLYYKIALWYQPDYKIYRVQSSEPSNVCSDLFGNRASTYVKIEELGHMVVTLAEHERWLYTDGYADTFCEFWSSKYKSHQFAPNTWFNMLRPEWGVGQIAFSTMFIR